MLEIYRARFARFLMEIFREVLHKTDSREAGKPGPDQIEPHRSEHRRQEVFGLLQVSQAHSRKLAAALRVRRLFCAMRDDAVRRGASTMADKRLPPAEITHQGQYRAGRAGCHSK